MNLINQYRNLPQQIYIICGARIITAMGMFIYSFTSLILTSILGFSEVFSGYTLMASSLAGIAGAFIFGKLADNFGRKKILMGLLLIGAINLFIGGIICHTPYVIITILLTNFSFSGVLPIIAAMVTDVTSEKNRAQSFSLMWLCINMGFAIGQLFAGILFYNFYPWIFIGQGIGWVIAAAIIGIFLKDIYVPRKTIQEKSKNSLFSLVIKDWLLVIFIIGMVLLTFAHMQVSFMVPLEFKKTIGLEACAKFVSYLWLINGVCCVLFTPALSLTLQRIGPLKCIFLAALIYTIGFGSYTFSTNTILYLLAVPFWTCGEVLLNTTAGVFIASRAPESHRARYQSLTGFAQSLGNCLAPVIMSYFLTSFTYQQGWLLTGCVSLTALILIAITFKKAAVPQS